MLSSGCRNSAGEAERPEYPIQQFLGIATILWDLCKMEKRLFDVSSGLDDVEEGLDGCTEQIAIPAKVAVLR